MERIKFERQIKIPKVEMAPDLKHYRTLQIVANYFEIWKELVAEEFGREKANELGTKFGALQGKLSGKLYRQIMEKQGKSLDDLEAMARIIAVSADIMGENYNYWQYGPKKTIYRTAGCATLKEQYDKTGTVLEHPPYDYKECIDRCDLWMDETFKAINPAIKVKRTKDVVNDGICEWDVWLD